MAKPKLFIATPCNRSLPYEYVESLAGTWRWLSDRYDLGVGFASSPLVYINRNELIQKAHDDNVDYMLMVDSDMDWTPEMVHEMVKFNKDVVTGVCMSRKPVGGNTYLPALYKREDNEYRVMADFPNTPFRVDACGAAFLMFNKKVIHKMVKRIPVYGYPFDPLCGEGVGIKMVSKTRFLGEDFAFSYRLYEAGFEILCLPGVRVGHLVQFSLGKNA